MGYMCVIRVLISGKRKKFSSSSKCLDWLWAPPSLVFCGYVGVQQLGYEVKNCFI